MLAVCACPPVHDLCCVAGPTDQLIELWVDLIIINEIVETALNSLRGGEELHSNKNTSTEKKSIYNIHVHNKTRLLHFIYAQYNTHSGGSHA